VAGELARPPPARSPASLQGRPQTPYGADDAAVQALGMPSRCETVVTVLELELPVLSLWPRTPQADVSPGGLTTTAGLYGFAHGIRMQGCWTCCT